MLERIKGAVFERLFDILQGVESIAGTVDGWSDMQRRKMIAFTGHFITKEWTMMNVVLGVEYFEGYQTGETLSACFKDILSRYVVQVF